MSLTLSLVFLEDETIFLEKFSEQIIKKANPQTWENFLLDQFNIEAPVLPFAALGAFALNLSPHNSFWLRADPVYLQSDFSQVYVHETKPSAEEQVAIQKIFLPYLQQENISLIIADNEWYLNVPHCPDMVTTPLMKVVGKPIFDYLPKGNEAGIWQRWMTEMQMLLTQAAVGQTNGLWLWGEGKLPVQAATQFTAICTDVNWLKGLVKLARGNDAVDLMSVNEGHYLLMLNDPNQVTNLFPLLLKRYDEIEIFLQTGVYAYKKKSWWRKFF